MSHGADLDEAIQSVLTDETGKECYLIRVPPNPDVPYTVLYPMLAPRGFGSWFNPEEDRDYTYQVTSVGLDYKQVRWMQEMVEVVFMSRGTGGDYEFPIEPGNGKVVYGRQSDQLGAIVASGDQLFKADDTYRVRMGND